MRLCFGTHQVARRMLLLQLTAMAALRAGAAQTSSTMTVEGSVFDSLHMRPLSDAFIAIQGTGKSATTNSRGQFRFDSVALGSHAFVLQHALLDSLGISGIATQALVPSSGASIKLAIPSFGKFWRGACGYRPEEHFPRSSGPCPALWSMTESDSH